MSLGTRNKCGTEAKPPGRALACSLLSSFSMKGNSSSFFSNLIDGREIFIFEGSEMMDGWMRMDGCVGGFNSTLISRVTHRWLRHLITTVEYVGGRIGMVQATVDHACAVAAT